MKARSSSGAPQVRVYTLVACDIDVPSSAPDLTICVQLAFFSVFNFRRNEVRSFLLGAAYHWLRRYHIDGLRIDAVSAMLYKNYQRPDGEWLPNEFGGDANLEAISLLQELNWVIHKEFPGVFTMAEESTSWRGVTDKVNGEPKLKIRLSRVIPCVCSKAIAAVVLAWSHEDTTCRLVHAEYRAMCRTRV